MVYLKFIAHSCQKPGCSNVLILDGNMKTCRQVCSAKEITALTFKTVNGQVVTGNCF